MKFLDKLFKRKTELPTIVERTNTIQYDCMGYSLRLLKMSDGNYMWLDTYEEEGDVAITPEQALILNKRLKFKE